MNPLLHAGAMSLAIAAGAAVAHGDEPHGDAPHPPAVATATGPRFEASTPLFELVGRLEDGALTLWLNRFASGEPVAAAALELQLDALQTVARYRAPQGDYRVEDAAFVAALARPGPHPLVLTVTAGDEADLLDATLNMPAAPAAGETPDAGPGLRRLAGPVLLVLAAAAGLGIVWCRRRRDVRETTA